jgi:hypothetical protein
MGIYGIYLNQSIKKNPKITTMIGKNRQLVADELVEFQIYPVEVQDCRKITDYLEEFIEDTSF